MIGQFPILSAKTLLLDHLDNKFAPDGKKKTTAQFANGRVNQPGGIAPVGSKFLPAKFGTGIECPKGYLSYPALGNINLEQGTIEMWVKVNFDFAKSKKFRTFLQVEVAKGQKFALYYHPHEKRLIFFARNIITPQKWFHSKGIAFLLNSTRLNWKKGETHHISIAYEKGRQQICIDGVISHSRSFPGTSLTNNLLTPKSKLLFGSAGFIIDEIKISDKFLMPQDYENPSQLSQAGSSKKIPVYQKRNCQYRLDSPYVKQSGGEWIMGNKEFEFKVSKKDGAMTSFILKNNNINILNSSAYWLIGKQKIQKLNLATAKVVNSEGLTELAVSATTDKGQKVALKFRVNKDHWSWIAIASGKSVECIFPALQSGMKGFVALAGSPFDADKGNEVMGNLKRFVWRSGWAEGMYPLSLPLGAFYDENKDFGLTFTIEPYKNPENYAVFEYFPKRSGKTFVIKMNARENSSAKQNYYEVAVKLHKGDFRPSLGWIYQRHPELYEAPNKAVHDWIGTSQCNGSMQAKDIKRVVQEGRLVWRHMNTDYLWMRYGAWIPDDLSKHPKTVNELNNIRAQVKRLHKYGAKGLLYCQAIDCSSAEYADKNFPEAIQRRADGSKISSVYGYRMNPLNPKWANHIYNQVDRMLQLMPQVDGIFWDLSSLYGQEKLIKRINTLLRSKGKFFIGNGALMPQCQYFDVVLCECERMNVQTASYCALNKPLFFLPVYFGKYPSSPATNVILATSDPENVEKDLKAVFKSGAFLEFQWKFGFGQKSLDLLHRYLRLSKHFAGRHWVFTAHALKLPKDLQGNIFTNKFDEYIVPVVAPAKSYLQPTVPYKNLKITMNLPDAKDIKGAFFKSMEQKGIWELPMQKQGRKIIVTIPEFGSAGLLILRKNGVQVSLNSKNISVAITDGTKVEIPIKISSLDSKAHSAAVKVSAQGKTYNFAVELPAEGSKIITVPLKIEEKMAGGAIDFEVDTVYDQTIKLNQKFQLKVAAPVKCEIVDTKVSSTGATLNFIVSNLGTRKVDLRIAAKSQKGSKIKFESPVKFSIASQRRHNVKLHFVPNAELTEDTINITLSNDKLKICKNFDLKIKRAMATIKAKRLRKTIRIDGNLSEWQNANGVFLGVKHQKVKNWGGNSDLSGDLYLQWDDKYLYIAAKVIDDELLQPYSMHRIWAADCIQLGFSGPRGVTEMGLALANEKTPQAYFWSPDKKLLSSEEGSIAIKREKLQMTYEVAIPWKELPVVLPMKTGDELRFSFTFNDADKAGREITQKMIENDQLFKGWLEWTPGICGGKNISSYGKIVLAK